MDSLIYTAMSGAKHVLEMQSTASNNLANVNTTGFRAQFDAFRAIPVVNGGMGAQTYVTDSTVGYDFTPGTMEQTGNNLDVAVQTKGWIAVDMGNGTEAYTRNGSFQISPNGQLQTWNGLAVQGISGPIIIPPAEQVQIGSDGTVSSIPTTGVMISVSILGQIKLVNPPETTMVHGDDGYFRLSNGKAADADPSVVLADGTLEGSNVKAVSDMVNMIGLSRQFEMQMKLLTNAENNDSQAAQFLTLA